MLSTKTIILHKCPVKRLYCPEQIAIPIPYPDILKIYAKAAIRTQPCDLLRWSAEYFRALANNASPPEKCRLERDCRQGSLTKGYLKALIAQVGKGYFISRCLLQEKWRSLCLDPDDLLKYLSLCRMVMWPQVHWLKVVAVMIGSLNKTQTDTMVMICELLTDDVEGGQARMPYWMFKICYTFVAELDCSQEQCFVNGQLVLPYGGLEEPLKMDKLPRVLSATLLQDTIVNSCKWKFAECGKQPCQDQCESEVASTTSSMDYMMNNMKMNIDNPQEMFDKCEDFETIMCLLQETQDKPLTEEDFKGPHYISEKQILKAQKKEDAMQTKRKQQSDLICKEAKKQVQKEAFQMLKEIGPPWTWLHKFTETARNTTSFNFIDVESIKSDFTVVSSSDETFDFLKEERICPAKKEALKAKDSSSSSSSCERERSLESLKSMLEEAEKQEKCDSTNTSSVLSYLRSDETILMLAGEPFAPLLNLADIIRCLKRAILGGKEFTSLEQLIEYIRLCLFGDITDFPVRFPPVMEESELSSITPDDDWMIESRDDTMSIPDEWKEKPPPKDVVVPAKVESGPAIPTEGEQPKEDMAKIFENTVGIPPEQVSKLPKFCTQPTESDELILGLMPLEEPSTPSESIDMGSSIPDSVPPNSELGYLQDDEGPLSPDVRKKRTMSDKDRDYFCCATAPTLVPTVEEPPPEYRCTIPPLAGIGPTIPEKVVKEFLAYLRVRARCQRGMICPSNFKEPRCPYMVDPKQSSPVVNWFPKEGKTCPYMDSQMPMHSTNFKEYRCPCYTFPYKPCKTDPQVKDVLCPNFVDRRPTQPFPDPKYTVAQSPYHSLPLQQKDPCPYMWDPQKKDPQDCKTGRCPCTARQQQPATDWRTTDPNFVEGPRPYYTVPPPPKEACPCKVVKQKTEPSTNLNCPEPRFPYMGLPQEKRPHVCLDCKSTRCPCIEKPKKPENWNFKDMQCSAMWEQKLKEPCPQKKDPCALKQPPCAPEKKGCPQQKVDPYPDQVKSPCPPKEEPCPKLEMGCPPPKEPCPPPPKDPYPKEKASSPPPTEPACKPCERRAKEAASQTNGLSSKPFESSSKPTESSSKPKETSSQPDESKPNLDV